MAVVSVWFLGCAINVIQTPLRAIIADIAPESQQELGQSISSIWQAIGGIVGFLVGYIWDPLTIMRPYFVASATALVATTTIACFVAKEVRIHSRPVVVHALTRLSWFAWLAETPREFDGHHRVLWFYRACVFRCVRRHHKNANGNAPHLLPSVCDVGCVVRVQPQLASLDGPVHLRRRHSAPWNKKHASDGCICTVCAVGWDWLLACLTSAGRGQQLGGLGQAIASGVQCVCSFLVPSVVRMAGLRSVYVGCFLVFVASFVGMGLLPARTLRSGA